MVKAGEEQADQQVTVFPLANRSASRHNERYHLGGRFEESPTLV